MENLSNPRSASKSFAGQSSTSRRWLRHFATNRQNRPEPDWDAPSTLDDGLRRRLALSLSHFQLGETGGGRFLMKEASRGCDPADLEALKLFVREEAEHARLLACLVERLGGRLVKRHWTHRLFKLARRAAGFHFEIQVLLIAELVGTTYYRAINRGVQDSAVNAAVALMLRDEASHVAFHLDRLKARRSAWLPLERAAWDLQFQLLTLAALRAAWLDHGSCLWSVGCTWEDFRQQARHITIRFLDQLRSSACPRQDSAVEASAPSESTNASVNWVQA